jgi:hypothetical protein
LVVCRWPASKETMTLGSPGQQANSNAGRRVGNTGKARRPCARKTATHHTQQRSAASPLFTPPAPLYTCTRRVCVSSCPVCTRARPRPPLAAKRGRGASYTLCPHGGAMQAPPPLSSAAHLLHPFLTPRLYTPLPISTRGRVGPSGLQNARQRPPPPPAPVRLYLIMYTQQGPIARK